MLLDEVEKNHQVEISKGWVQQNQVVVRTASTEIVSHDQKSKI